MDATDLCQQNRQARRNRFRPSRSSDRRVLRCARTYPDIRKPPNLPHDANFPNTFDGIHKLTSTLRGPDGCLWDKEQTPESLKHLFLEECYELVEAIEQGDAVKIVEELGDVLFHAAFQIAIAEETGAFTGEDVFRGIIEKLVRRHPHVFGDVVMEDASQAVPRWDRLKRQEIAGTGRSILDGVPKAMPSLGYAQAVQGRAARMGFDWDEYGGVIAKVAEEVRELESAGSDSEREQELGDLLFSLVNASRWLGIEAETALRGTNRKFYARFTAMERTARERGLDMDTMSLDAKEDLWQQAKSAESGPGGRVSDSG